MPLSLHFLINLSITFLVKQTKFIWLCFDCVCVCVKLQSHSCYCSCICFKLQSHRSVLLLFLHLRQVAITPVLLLFLHLRQVASTPVNIVTVLASASSCNHTCEHCYCSCICVKLQSHLCCYCSYICNYTLTRLNTFCH